jgi:dUTP pyrophosphatase
MIQVIKEDWVPAFKKSTEYSAGYDLWSKDFVRVEPMQTVLIPTGIRVNMMHDSCSFAMVVPRSGMSLKTNLRICNSPGIIDMDYRGEIKIIMQNIGDKFVDIEPMTRIAQLVFCHYGNSSIDFVKEFTDTTDRGEGGFGSTGTK